VGRDENEEIKEVHKGEKMINLNFSKRKQNKQTAKLFFPSNPIIILTADKRLS
jgi:hypothetical protein